MLMMRRFDMKHVDIFSGIGGFALAAQANGIVTSCFVEKDERCRAFLSKAWPGITIHDDIKTFDGSDYIGSFLLTAGVPCQPASRAGKQRGKKDDRWLWPEAIRALDEVRPTWAIYENPPGIGDVGLDRILFDMESKGYKVRVFSIPACAVNAPQKRERYWIVCRNLSDATRRENDGGKYGDMAEAQGCRESGNAAAGRICKCMANPIIIGNDAWQKRYNKTHNSWIRTVNKGLLAWSNYVWIPCADGKVRRAPNDSVQLVDGLHRSVLGALGNSIVPQVAARIIHAIVDAERGR